MYGCEYYLKQMSAFIDGELDDCFRAELSDHLKTCPGCLNASLAYKAINEAILDGETEPPEEFCAGVMSRIHAQKKRSALRPWKTVCALAAAVVIVVVTVIAAPSIFNSNKNRAENEESATGEQLMRSMAQGEDADSSKMNDLALDESADSSTKDSKDNLSGNEENLPGEAAPAAPQASAQESPTESGESSALTYTEGFETNGVPVQVNDYACSAIIVLDPEITPPEVLDQYTYYSWMEEDSQYLIISGELYDELLECLRNLDIVYTLDVYSQIKNDGWVLLITAPKA